MRFHISRGNIACSVPWAGSDNLPRAAWLCQNVCRNNLGRTCHRATSRCRFGFGSTWPNPFPSGSCHRVTVPSNFRHVLSAGEKKSRREGEFSVVGSGYGSILSKAKPINFPLSIFLSYLNFSYHWISGECIVRRNALDFWQINIINLYE